MMKLNAVEKIMGNAKGKFEVPEVEIITFSENVVASSSCPPVYCRGYCSENYCTQVCQGKCNYVVCDNYN